MIITGPKFEIGQIVKSANKTPKSNELFKKRRLLEPNAKIINIEIVKRFPAIDSDDEHIYMLEFENGIKIASNWFEPI